ncbi:TRAP transporter small permease [Billgrantia lactosivorans]|uniref:TRAP transporter small permease n=1 Tax=Billgrantia lactosivorans TaxID=2185141 RepID=UPI0013A6EE5B|nr:TRAP transporter small permease [Halomonas lactosivorans]
MQNPSRNLFRAIDIFSEVLAISMLIVGFLVVALGVMSRYVFSTPVPWTGEVARFAFIWLSLSGIAVVERKRAHFRIDMLVLTMPIALQRLIFFIREAVILTVLALMLIQGLQFTYLGLNAYSTTLQIPLYIVYGALPLSVTFTLVNRLRVVSEDFKDLYSLNPQAAQKARATSSGGTE